MPAAASSSGRFLFLVPWRDVSIVGTSHDAHDGDADAASRSRTAHVEALLADARDAFPRADLTAADVRLVHRGLLPMLDGRRLARQAAARKPGGRSRRRRAPGADLDLRRALHHRPPHAPRRRWTLVMADGSAALEAARRRPRASPAPASTSVAPCSTRRRRTDVPGTTPALRRAAGRQLRHRLAPGRRPGGRTARRSPGRWPRTARSPGPRSSTPCATKRQSPWPTRSCGAPRPARLAIPGRARPRGARRRSWPRELGWDAAAGAPPRSLTWRRCYPAGAGSV